MFGDSRNKRMREHSRRISRDVNRSTLGSHAGGSLPNARQGNYGSSINFSSRRKSSRARSGEINVVVPNTASGESRRAYSRRVARPDFGKRVVRRSRLLGIASVVGIIVAIAVIVGGVSAFTYINTVSSKMVLDNDEARSLLVSPTASEPYYVLVVGVFEEPGSGQENADMITLVRVDLTNKSVSLMSIPPNLEVDDGSNGETFLAQTYATGGDAAVIEQVSSMMDVDIAHYVKLDEEGFVRMVDNLGGITVDVTEEVDDPYAGSIYLAPGEQTLNGEQAWVYVRARNYKDSTIQREACQMKAMVAIAQKVMDTGTAGLPAFVDGLADCIKTDYSAGDITSLVETMRGIDVSSIAEVQMPGYLYTNNDGNLAFVQSSSWSDALASFKENGTVESTGQVDTSDVDPGSFTVIVRNGGGITGAAADFSSILTENGFQVIDVGNADSSVYEETLVVYKDDDKESAAQAVVDAMGIGRITNASAYYSFDSDVLVMIGRDYKPTS